MSINLAIKDFARFTQNVNGWAAVITLTSPDNVTYTVNGLASKHFVKTDADGVAFAGKNAHVTISEEAFNIAGVVYKDTEGEVNLENWRVAYADSSGTVHNYVVESAHPDATVGGIYLMLKDYIV